jgi:hypothetical protein
MERRYNRTSRELTDDPIQENLNFQAEPSATVNSSTEGLTALGSLDETTAPANVLTPLKAEAESPYGTSAPLATAQAAGF